MNKPFRIAHGFRLDLPQRPRCNRKAEWARRLVARAHSDDERPRLAALPIDGVPLAALPDSVSPTILSRRSRDPPFRRDRDRRRPGRAVDGRPDRRNRKESRPDRAQAHRWNLRQQRLHADQGDGRQRLCRAPCKARLGFRRDRRNCGRRFRRCNGPQEQDRRRLPLRPRGLAARAFPIAPSSKAKPASCRRLQSRQATTCSRPNASSSTSVAAPMRRTSQVAIRSRRSTARGCSNSTPCLHGSSSLEEAISGSSSHKYSGALAPPSQWWRRCRA